MKELFNLGDFNELFLTECGRESCKPVKDIVSDVKLWHTVHYVLHGKGVFVLNEKTYYLEKGDLFYIPPGLSSHYYPDKVDPWVYAWIGFDGTFAQKVVERCGLSLTNPRLNDSKKTTLKSYFNELVDRYNDSADFGIGCMAMAMEIFWRMIKLANTKPAVIGLKSGHVHEAKQFVANNYQFPITVKDIAKSLGLSPNYLANIFQEILKTSPKQYLINYRINKACHLLSGNNTSIKDVAAKVGYSNQLHFSAAFKKIKHIPPLAYQTKIQKEKI